MCPISFAIKRIHLAGLRLYRKQLKNRVTKALTPARVDIMRIVHEHQRVEAPGVAQTKIQELLDLHPSVISRMIGRMFEIGLLEVWANPNDARCNMVGLSEVGKELLELYFAELGDTKEVEQLQNLAWFGKRRDKRGGDTLRKARISSYRLLNRIRIAMRDKAPFLHPWTIKDAVILYNHTDLAHPFKVEHWSGLNPDDIDDGNYYVSSADSPPPAPRSS